MHACCLFIFLSFTFACTNIQCYDQPDEDLLKVVKPPKTSVPKRPGKSKQTQPKKQEEQVRESYLHAFVYHTISTLGKESLKNFMGKAENSGHQHFHFFHYKDETYLLCCIGFFICSCFQFGWVENSAMWKRFFSNTGT